MDAVRALCDRCVVMSSGRKIAEGATADVLSRCGRREGLSRRGGRRCLRSAISAWPMACIARSTASRSTSSAARSSTILGANGAGKTSLLKAIAGVVRTLPGKQVSLAGRDISAPAGPRDRRERAGAGARRARHLRRPDGEGKPAARRQSEARPRRRSGAARTGARAVSAPARTRRPDRAHHERRRAADARDRPRADVQPGYPVARRAVARAVACHGAGIVRNACGGCARPASDCCWSSRTRRRACASPTAAMCSRTASSSGTAPPIS